MPASASLRCSRLRGRCRCVGEVELATDARQRIQHLPIKRAQLIEVLAEEFGGRGGDLDRRQDTQVPGRSPPGADGNERSFPLRAMQQLADLQRIALGSVMKLGGDIA